MFKVWRNARNAREILATEGLNGSGVLKIFNVISFEIRN